MKKWTEAEEQYLIANYNTKTPQQLADELGKIKQGIYQKACQLGIRKSKYSKRTNITDLDDGYDPETFFHPDLFRKVHTEDITGHRIGGGTLRVNDIHQGNEDMRVRRKWAKAIAK